MSQPKYLYSVASLLGGTRAAKPSALGRLVGLPVTWLPVPDFTGYRVYQALVVITLIFQRASESTFLRLVQLWAVSTHTRRSLHTN
jgi:hypothetical protein